MGDIPQVKTPDLAAAFRDALRPMVRDVVAEVLTEFLEAEPLKPELLTRQQVAQVLQISSQTVMRMVKEGMPMQRIGDSPRFKVAHVLAWIEERSKRAPE